MDADNDPNYFVKALAILEEELEKKNIITVNEFAPFAKLYSKEAKANSPGLEMEELAKKFQERFDLFGPIRIVDNSTFEEVLVLPNLFTRIDLPKLTASERRNGMEAVRAEFPNQESKYSKAYGEAVQNALLKNEDALIEKIAADKLRYVQILLKLGELYNLELVSTADTEDNKNADDILENAATSDTNVGPDDYEFDL